VIDDDILKGKFCDPERIQHWLQQLTVPLSVSEHKEARLLFPLMDHEQVNFFLNIQVLESEEMVDGLLYHRQSVYWLVSSIPVCFVLFATQQWYMYSIFCFVIVYTFISGANGSWNGTDGHGSYHERERKRREAKNHLHRRTGEKGRQGTDNGPVGPPPPPCDDPLSEPPPPPPTKEELWMKDYGPPTLVERRLYRTPEAGEEKPGWWTSHFMMCAPWISYVTLAHYQLFILDDFQYYNFLFFFVVVLPYFIWIYRDQIYRFRRNALRLSILIWSVRFLQLDLKYWIVDSPSRYIAYVFIPILVWVLYSDKYIEESEYVIKLISVTLVHSAYTYDPLATTLTGFNSYTPVQCRTDILRFLSKKFPLNSPSKFLPATLMFQATNECPTLGDVDSKEIFNTCLYYKQRMEARFNEIEVTSATQQNTRVVMDV